MAQLTPRQQEVFDFIQGFIKQTGMPPTRAEIAEAMGFRSPNAADDHLRALQQKGVLNLKKNASRGIQLLEAISEQLSLP
ncbi:MAG: repressor LexA, partial [Gammaproteobacteria bacterium]|nr:repressor LexA [Gammaproteobacteria bacterium]